MSQISKCPKLRVVSGYWEALGEVSELRYKNLLYISSKRSYCNISDNSMINATLSSMFSCLLITFSILYSLYLEFHHFMADSYISGSVIHYEEERFMLNGSGFPSAVQAPVITTNLQY